MNRRCACLNVLFFAATVLGQASVHADPIGILDQEIPALNFSHAFFGNVEHAQTFEVGISGQLAAVEIYLSNPFQDMPDQITVSIRSVNSSGFPSLLPTDNLAVATMPILSVPTSVGFVRVDFPSPLPGANIGDQLAVIMRANGPTGNLNWQGMFRDVYPRGSFYSRFYETDGAWISSVADFSMRTYVIPVPEPSSQILLGCMSVMFAILTFARVRE